MDENEASGSAFWLQPPARCTRAYRALQTPREAGTWVRIREAFRVRRLPPGPNALSLRIVLAFTPV